MRNLLLLALDVSEHISELSSEDALKLFQFIYAWIIPEVDYTYSIDSHRGSLQTKIYVSNYQNAVKKLISLNSTTKNYKHARNYNS